jgi:hypothetical protein
MKESKSKKYNYASKSDVLTKFHNNKINTTCEKITSKNI